MTEENGEETERNQRERSDISVEKKAAETERRADAKSSGG